MLRLWHKKKFGCVKDSIECLNLELKKMQMSPKTNEIIQRKRGVKEVLNVLEKLETVWMQHSKVSWLREGDQNTTFFQSQASQRGKKRLEDQNEHRCMRIIPCRISLLATSSICLLLVTPLKWEKFWMLQNQEYVSICPMSYRIGFG